MEIVLIGLSHRTAPVEIREKFCIPREKVKEFLGQLAGVPGVREGMVLSTCNRMEVLGVVENGETEIARIGNCSPESVKFPPKN